MPGAEPLGPVAPDGSPHPDRRRPTFEREVRAMFSHIARGYEGFDHLASLGQDLLWRPRALWDLDRFRGDRPAPPRVLDLGCGTGELSRLAARHYPRSRVVGADFTRAMLEVARRSTRGRPEAGRIEFVEAHAGHLPFPSGRFDAVLSAFVARNLPDLAGAFAEMRRVLAPGGSVLTLEITGPASPRARAAFLAYFDRVVPGLGALVGSEGPYRYLPESLRHLPERGAVLGLLDRAGFVRRAARPQSLGIVTSFLGEAGAPSQRG